jgi:protein-S-isoprenylcysteine O-methyltransferase Ste14
VARALLNALLSTTLFAAALLAPAGAWGWSRAWILIGLYLLVHAVGTVRIVRANPALLPERAKLPVQRDQPLADKVLLLSFMATYAGELVLTGLDQRRWHWGVALPPAVAWLGIALFTAGWLLVMRALETNEFATMVVRHQSERGHLVVDRGVYRIVRHPMYAGLLGVLLGVPLWLRSELGLIAALVPMGLLIGRLLVEERVLQRALPSYADYVARVRFRLVPGVW